MATAISSAFQSNKTEDEQSYQPSRRAPPIPTVAYNATVANRAPEQGERPIYQANTTQLRQQQQAQAAQGAQAQYSPQFQQQPPQQAQQQQQQQSPPAQYHYYPQQRQPPNGAQSVNSRPSTQQTSVSQPQSQSQSVRGRQNIDNQNPPIPSYPPSSVASAGAREAKKRSNSFSFLRRSSSTAPSPRVAQVQNTATAAHQSQSSEGSINTSSSIFRSRSRDAKSERNMLRKQSKLKQQQEELERQRRAAELAARPAPRLPEQERLPYIETFGGDNNANTNIPGGASAPPANFSRPSATSVPSRSGAASPPPSSSAGANGDYYEPSGERSSSMTNRGRYSYASSTAQVAGSVNSPRRVRRRKDPTPFKYVLAKYSHTKHANNVYSVLVIGTKNSGKTSFISFLRNSLALRADKQDVTNHANPANKSAFTSQYLETEMDGERIGVTLWDSVGLEKNIVDLQLREMTAFIESKFEDTFSEEQKVVRSPGFRDTHIHCVFLVLDPIRLDSNVTAAASAGRGSDGLDQAVDLQVLKTLWGKTTVIPVISKADTLTTNHMMFLKRAVWQSVKSAKLSPLDALELDDDDEEDLDDEEDEDLEEEVKPKRPSHNRQSSLSSTISDEDPYIPMSILSPDPYSMPPYTKYAPRSQSEIGRRFAWGFASPFDPQHCDFIRLRDTIFSEWRADLRDLSRVKWYEQWRTSRLRHTPAVNKRAGMALSGSSGIPIRDAAQTNGRDVSGPNVPRTAPLNTQQPQETPRQAPVGMAVTTPGGMESQY